MSTTVGDTPDATARASSLVISPAAMSASRSGVSDSIGARPEASEAAAGDEGKEEVIEGKDEGEGVDFRVLRASKKRYRDFGTACKNGDVEEVRRLFALDNNLSSTRSTIDDAQGKVWTDTPLGWAVSSSSTEVVEYLLGHGADPNQMGAYVWREERVNPTRAFTRSKTAYCLRLLCVY